MDEKELAKQYLEAGVDLPELKEPEQEPEKEEAQEDPTPEPQTEEKEPEKSEEEPLQESKEQRKRSIYDEYKDKKAELRTEREAREQAEKERDEYRQKLEALSHAETPEEQKDAQDEIEAFATKRGLDAEALREMRSLFLKDVKPQTDENLSKDLQEFKAWKSQNAQIMEKSMFDAEFESTLPTLKEMFKGANDEELNTIKKELDRLSHSKEYHDKELDYVAYKNQKTLSALVSPKKRGLESRTKVDVQEDSYEFDPEADISKMTPKQLESWEKEYRKATSSNTLLTDTHGKKIMV